VIVGGGLAGAATAYELTTRGLAQIVVLESEATTGYHSSGRSAALCTQLHGDDVVCELAVAGAAFLREPPPEVAHGRALLSETGSLWLSDSTHTVDDLEARATARNVAHSRVDMPWVLERFPRLSGLHSTGGVFVAKDGVVDVHALLKGLLDATRAAGGHVETSCPVKGFSGRGEGVIVSTPRGDVFTRCVVNASGAWAGKVGKMAGSKDVLFTPMLRHIHLTERIAGLDASLPYVWNLADEEFYFRAEGEQLLLCSCDETISDALDARVLAGAKEELASKLEKAAPWLAGYRIERSWAGLRTFSSDRRPVIGWDRKLPWFYWVAGLGGYGVTTSPAVGRLAASDIAGRLLD